MFVNDENIESTARGRVNGEGGDYMGCMAELDWRPSVMRRLYRVAHLAAVLPSHHSPSSETESRSPVRGQLVAYSCLSVHVHSLPSSVYPPNLLATENPPLPSGSSEKMVAPECPRHFCYGIRTVLIRQIPAGEICSTETPVVDASCAS